MNRNFDFRLLLVLLALSQFAAATDSRKIIRVTGRVVQDYFDPGVNQWLERAVAGNVVIRFVRTEGGAGQTAEPETSLISSAFRTLDATGNFSADFSYEADRVSFSGPVPTGKLHPDFSIQVLFQDPAASPSPGASGICLTPDDISGGWQPLPNAILSYTFDGNDMDLPELRLSSLDSGNPGASPLPTPSPLPTLSPIPVPTDSDGDGLSDDAESANYGTSPYASDTDGDGLSDAEELFVHNTSPVIYDTDAGGINDGNEIQNATSPIDAMDDLNAYDSDADGLSDGAEMFSHSTSPYSADTDGDTLNDAAELFVHHTSPLDADTDAGGINDGSEAQNATNPLDVADDYNAYDSDGDGLNDGAERAIHGTDPYLADTDSDGLSDSQEVLVYQTLAGTADSDGAGINDGTEAQNATNPLDPLDDFNAYDSDGDGLSDGVEIFTYATDPHRVDTDGDGLTDADELLVHHTQPLSADTDGSGINDGTEIQNGTNPVQSGDDYNAYDTDGDGLSDGAERDVHGTDPNLSDTDGDGLGDNDEIQTHQTNPTVADTDGGGVDDGVEIQSSTTNPLDPADDNVAVVNIPGDTDEDGVTGADDRCPQIAGSNQGCPRCDFDLPGLANLENQLRTQVNNEDSAGRGDYSTPLDGQADADVIRTRVCTALWDLGNARYTTREAAQHWLERSIRNQLGDGGYRDISSVAELVQWTAPDLRETVNLLNSLLEPGRIHSLSLEIRDRALTAQSHVATVTAINYEVVSTTFLEMTAAERASTRAQLEVQIRDLITDDEILTFQCPDPAFPDDSPERKCAFPVINGIKVVVRLASGGNPFVETFQAEGPNQPECHQFESDNITLKEWSECVITFSPGGTGTGTQLAVLPVLRGADEPSFTENANTLVATLSWTNSFTFPIGGFEVLRYTDAAALTWAVDATLEGGNLTSSLHGYAANESFIKYGVRAYIDRDGRRWYSNPTGFAVLPFDAPPEPMN